LAWKSEPDDTASLQVSPTSEGEERWYPGFFLKRLRERIRERRETRTRRVGK